MDSVTMEVCYALQEKYLLIGLVAGIVAGVCLVLLLSRAYYRQKRFIP
jgi:uncharacterized membrane-anchored protein YhcB (DUF1043 family)